MGRGRLLKEALRALVILRRGRWTIAELGDELGIALRSAYRLMDALRDAGVIVEVSRELSDQRGMAPAHYEVPAEPLRKLLRL